MTLRTIRFAAALTFAACGPADGPGAVFSNDPHAVPIPLIRFRSDSIAFAQYSGVGQAQNFVIRDAAAWSDLWQRIYANYDPVPPLPDVDFGQEMVVALALGTRNSGGYNVLFARAATDSAGIVIAARETSPGAHCFVTQALSQPIDLARLARSDQTVRFVLTQQVVDCGS